MPPSTSADDLPLFSLPPVARNHQKSLRIFGFAGEHFFPQVGSYRIELVRIWGSFVGIIIGLLAKARVDFKSQSGWIPGSGTDPTIGQTLDGMCSWTFLSIYPKYSICSI